MAVGTVLSTIVTVELHVAVLPLLSVTVNTTVLAPIFAQPKVLGAKLREVIPQASVEPLSTDVASTVALPAALKFTVKF